MVQPLAEQSADPLEADLLRLFRGFTGVLWLLLTLVVLPWLLRRAAAPDLGTLGNWLQTGVLLLVLWWRGLRRWLGPRFLPFALTVATLGPILAQWYTTLRGGAADPIGDLNRLYFWLLLPLVLISARYSFRAVLLFTVGSALLSTLLALSYVSGPDIARAAQQGFGRVLLLTLAGYLIERIARAQRTQRQQLAQRNAALADHASTLEQLATSRERNRLARDLHDTLAHTLSAIDVQLKALEVQLTHDPPAARLTLQQTQELTRGGLHEARRALQALRAQPLEQLGLLLALRQLAEGARARAGLSLTTDLPERVGGLRAEAEQQLYRIAEETLHNVVRHAQARNLTVRLQQDDRATRLEIADDGVGFAAEPGGDGGRYGLRGLHERAALLGATLQIQSAPGAGTTVSVTLPTTRNV